MPQRRPAPRRMIEPLEPRLLLSSAELIRNGGFESALTPAADWTATGDFQADSRFTNVHTGTGYAYLANADGSSGNSLAGSISQPLSIPASTSSLTLNFWTKITTSETTATAANDVMTVRLMDAAGTTVLQSAATYSNLNASSSYVQRTIFLDRSLIGRSVRLAFSASTDASLPTTFRVDDVSLNAVTTATSRRVVGYLPQYRYSSFNKVDLAALTHVNYFSVTANGTGTLSSGNVNASNLDAAVAALHAAGVTVSITVGPVSFSTLAASATARVAFANNIVNYALAHNLDGVDIDWEPPAGNNVPNYGLLINDLYAVAHPQHLLITAAVNPWTNEIPAATVNAKMDWLNVMCYDFAPANHSTYADSVSGMVDWTNYGVAKNKLLMGVPFYGKSGTSWSNDVSRTYGAIVSDYYNLHGAYPAPDVNSYVDGSGATFYFNGLTAVEQKAAYVRDNGYGGMMIWELGQDSWDAAGHYNQYSLLPVLKSIMNPPAWLSAAAGSRFDLVNNTLSVHAGTVTLTSDLLAANPNLNVSVSAGATLLLDSPQHLATLTITAGGAVTLNSSSNNALVVSALSLAPTAKLDLKNNALLINYTGTSPLATLLPRLLAGRNGGAWTGAGITSSTAAADPSRITAVGYAEASSLGRSAFAGQPVDATTLLLRYTYYGDTDLDGAVTADDIARTDRGFARGLTGWINGDFDYSSPVASADYTLLYKAFAAHAPPIPEPLWSTPEPTGITLAAQTTTAIPEPPPADSPTALPDPVPAIAAPLNVTFAGPSRAKASRSVTFRLRVPNTHDAAATKRRVRVAVDWNGDGRTDQIVTARAGSTLRLGHAYHKAGRYRPSVRILGPVTAAISKALKLRVT